MSDCNHNCDGCTASCDKNKSLLAKAPKDSNIKKIISLSCDPSTHARDCKKLIEAGYKIKKIYLLDFYPNTSHIESLVVFQK